MLSILLFTFFVDGTSSSLSCHNQFSCSQANTSNSSGAECYGSLSCIDANFDTSSSSDFECDGRLSCYKASLKSSNSGNIRCSGLLSCENAMLSTNEGNITCDGEQSCYNSDITISTTGTLTCGGDRSCAYANISGGSEININGYYAAYGATFYGYDYDVTYNFYGRMSGYGATIRCNTGNRCIFNCFGDSCVGLDWDCIGISCGARYSCENVLYNFGAYACPDLTNPVEIDDKLPNLYEQDIDKINETKIEFGVDISDIQWSDYNIASDTCFAAPIFCGSYYGCSNNLQFWIYGTPYCCTGGYSCNNITNVTIWADIDGDIIPSDIYDTSVRCDAYFACNGIDVLHASNGGHIYVTGSKAPVNTFGISLDAQDIDIMDESTIRVGIIDASEPNWDIFCTAKLACHGAESIRNGNNLLCTGESSCKGVGLIENINVVWAYGYDSMSNSMLNNISNHVFCGGYRSCFGSTIINATNVKHKNLFSFNFCVFEQHAKSLCKIQ